MPECRKSSAKRDPTGRHTTRTARHVLRNIGCWRMTIEHARHEMELWSKTDEIEKHPYSVGPSCIASLNLTKTGISWPRTSFVISSGRRETKSSSTFDSIIP